MAGVMLQLFQNSFKKLISEENINTAPALLHYPRSSRHNLLLFYRAIKISLLFEYVITG